MKSVHVGISTERVLVPRPTVKSACRHTDRQGRRPATEPEMVLVGHIERERVLARGWTVRGSVSPYRERVRVLVPVPTVRGSCRHIYREGPRRPTDRVLFMGELHRYKRVRAVGRSPSPDRPRVLARTDRESPCCPDRPRESHTTRNHHCCFAI